MNKYPKIFAQKDLSPQQTSMCWGISCGDGWLPLIDHLCYILQWDIDHNKEPQLEAVQVKEKFGQLCFYVSGASDAQYAMIRFAESLSTKICEECGTNHNVKQTDGWICTLCDKCLEKRDNK